MSDSAAIAGLGFDVGRLVSNVLLLHPAALRPLSTDKATTPMASARMPACCANSARDAVSAVQEAATSVCAGTPGLRIFSRLLPRRIPMLALSSRPPRRHAPSHLAYHPKRDVGSTKTHLVNGLIWFVPVIHRRRWVPQFARSQHFDLPDHSASQSLGCAVKWAIVMFKAVKRSVLSGYRVVYFATTASLPRGKGVGRAAADAHAAEGAERRRRWPPYISCSLAYRPAPAPTTTNGAQ
jgi:hypothetical protein